MRAARDILPWAILPEADGVTFGRTSHGSIGSLEFRTSELRLPDGEAVAWNDVISVDITVPTTPQWLAVILVWLDLLLPKSGAALSPVWLTVDIQTMTRNLTFELDAGGPFAWRIALATELLAREIEPDWRLLSAPTLWDAAVGAGSSIRSRARWLRHLDVGTALTPKIAGYEECRASLRRAVVAIQPRPTEGPDDVE